jgi:hypothetical protein
MEEYWAIAAERYGLRTFRIGFLGKKARTDVRLRSFLAGGAG